MPYIAVITDSDNNKQTVDVPGINKKQAIDSLEKIIYDTYQYPEKLKEIILFTVRKTTKINITTMCDLIKHKRIIANRGQEFELAKKEIERLQKKFNL